MEQSESLLPEGFEGNLEQYLSSIEREIVINALIQCKWNRTQAASRLGITFRSLRYRIARLGIEENGAGSRRRLPNGYTKVWPKLREVALGVLGRKCARCGSTNSIHVDHIKPLSKYPELALDLSNLQILCAPCNMSKGARDE